jgi:hypothetical protein
MIVVDNEHHNFIVGIQYMIIRIIRTSEPIVPIFSG